MRKCNTLFAAKNIQAVTHREKFSGCKSGDCESNVRMGTVSRKNGK